MTVTKFQAQEGTLAYSSAAETWATDTSADQVAFTANIAEVKDITCTIPEQATEQVRFYGATAQTVGANARTVGTATGPIAGTFQNQAIHVNEVGLWMVSGTVVLTGDEQFIDVLGLGTKTDITDSPAYDRYAVGDLSSGAKTMSLIGSLRFYLNNGSEAMSFVMTNVVMKPGPITVTGADGHYERTFEAVCLPKDGFLEFKE